ncbi:MAG: hypothetical protein DWQ53_06720 [Microcystis flos-aquae DF17]|nr:MAG: hypothetical protein DWQ53_06720 [Microcystis flos-aquae DF17]
MRTRQLLPFWEQFNLILNPLSIGYISGEATDNRQQATGNRQQAKRRINNQFLISGFSIIP